MEEEENYPPQAAESCMVVMGNTEEIKFDPTQNQISYTNQELFPKVESNSFQEISLVDFSDSNQSNESTHTGRRLQQEPPSKRIRAGKYEGEVTTSLNKPNSERVDTDRASNCIGKLNSTSSCNWMDTLATQGTIGIGFCMSLMETFNDESVPMEMRKKLRRKCMQTYMTFLDENDI